MCEAKKALFSQLRYFFEKRSHQWVLVWTVKSWCRKMIREWKGQQPPRLQMKTLLKWCRVSPWSISLCLLSVRIWCRIKMPRGLSSKKAAAAAIKKDWRAHQMSRGISPEKTPFHTVLPGSNQHLREPHSVLKTPDQLLLPDTHFSKNSNIPLAAEIHNRKWLTIENHRFSPTYSMLSVLYRSFNSWVITRR